MYPPTVYNDVDDVIMCCDLDPEPPSLWKMTKSDKVFCSKLHHIVIASQLQEPPGLTPLSFAAS